MFTLASKKRTTESTLKLDNSYRWLLLLSQFFVLLSLSSQLELWMMAIISLCLIWQCVCILNVRSRPNKFLLFFIALIGAIVIAISGKQLGLLLSMIHLICFAYTIKSMELNTRKDLIQIILLGIFLLACAFIFHQSVWFAIAVLCFLIIKLTVMYLYFAPRETIGKAIKNNATMLLLSMPLALSMFVLFPRLQPFWQMPIAKSAKTGLGNQVKPGDIASLARSNELAFRVNFIDKVPASSQMYWRAMTLPYYDGQGWQLGTDVNQNINWRLVQKYSQAQNIAVDTSGSFYQYQVIAEPSFQHWLFALDVAQVQKPSIFQLNDYSIRSNKPIAKTIAYDVKSYDTSPKELSLSAARKQQFLTLPKEVNPKLVEYANRLKNLNQSPKQVIKSVLARFSNQAYFYTLQPPNLINNSLDQFFFDTKSGFCEHYASTFSFIMRAAGIPSRVVTGYMGAKYNPEGQYYSIYQYDAHAWSEVWLAGEGWTRIDPTAAVSPDRVTLGLSQTLSEEKLMLENDYFNFGNFSHLAIIGKIKLQIEAIDYQWTRLVVGYSKEKQSQFLKELLGNGKLWKTAIIFIVSLMSVVLLLFLLHLKSTKPQAKEKWQRDFDAFLEQLHNKGYVRQSGQTIKAYFQTLEKEFSQSKGILACLWLSFYRLSYQRIEANDKEKELILFRQYLAKSNKLLKQHQ